MVRTSAGSGEPTYIVPAERRIRSLTSKWRRDCLVSTNPCWRPSPPLCYLYEMPLGHRIMSDGPQGTPRVGVAMGRGFT